MTDSHVPVTRADVADDNPRFLGNRIDALAENVRTGFDMLASKFMAAVERIERKFDGAILDVEELKRARRDSDQLLAEAVKRIDELERQPKRKARK